MGKNDSSKTRVVPVFSELRDQDPTGKAWLSKLLALPTRDGASSCSEAPLLMALKAA